MMKLVDGVLTVETATLIATIENGLLTSLRSRQTGTTYLRSPADEVGVSLVWMGGETKKLDTGSVECRLLSERRARIVYHSWYGDGVTMVTEDEATGDLLVRPSATSGRMGVKGCRFDLKGIDPTLDALVPTCQGVRLKLDDPLFVGQSFGWPCAWEVGLVLFESNAGDGFWVHCQDDRYQYKDLVMGTPDDPYRIGLVSEAYGPLDGNKSAGGITWRVNVYEGGWRVPAQRYKDWYWRAYGLAGQKARRLDWLQDVTMAVSWANSDTAALDALAKQVDPHKVLIHMAQWRDQKYDQDYPEYTPSAAAAAYIEHGARLGFRIAPHMNSMEIDPSHPVYPMLSDFQMLHTDTKTVYGWGFDGPNWRFLGVPWTEYAKTDPRNRPYNIMTKIHTGLSMWHAELYDRMEQVAERYPIAGCFIDVTLCSYNLHNCLVEGRTSTEGLNELIRLLGEIRGGLPIGGEGLNEITAQGLSFAQMHLYQSGHISAPGLERCGGDCAVNDFIFGELCRTMGYATLSGKTEDEALRLRVYDDHNTIPTITVNNPEELLRPNPVVAGVFARANG